LNGTFLGFCLKRWVVLAPGLFGGGPFFVHSLAPLHGGMLLKDGFFEVSLRWVVSQFPMGGPYNNIPNFVPLPLEASHLLFSIWV